MTLRDVENFLSQSEEVTPIAGAPTARIPASSVKGSSRKKRSRNLTINRNYVYEEVRYSTY
jgi:hypothetical protein